MALIGGPPPSKPFGQVVLRHPAPCSRERLEHRVVRLPLFVGPGADNGEVPAKRAPAVPGLADVDGGLCRFSGTDTTDDMTLLAMHRPPTKFHPDARPRDPFDARAASLPSSTRRTGSGICRRACQSAARRCSCRYRRIVVIEGTSAAAPATSSPGAGAEATARGQPIGVDDPSGRIVEASGPADVLRPRGRVPGRGRHVPPAASEASGRRCRVSHRALAGAGRRSGNGRVADRMR